MSNENQILDLKLKQNMLKFAQKLDAMDNAFLKDFSQYLRQTYEGDTRKEKTNSDWRMEKLEDFISRIYLLPKAPKGFQNKGCALLGETPFDKLDFTRAFLENYGDSEYTDDSVTKNRYAVVECEGKTKKPETMEKYARQYKDIPFVIFNNCENILNQENNLVLFKGLCADDRKLTFEDTNGEFKDYVVESLYILLGNENKMYEILEKPSHDLPEKISYSISRFQHFIHIFDIDKKS